MNDVSPANRSARPSAFAKLYYFMRPDRGRMAVSLLLACVGEAVGMVPYLVIALLAAGLVEGTLTLERAAWLAAAAALAHTARFFLTWRSSMMSHRVAFSRWPRRWSAYPWAPSSTRPPAPSKTASSTT